MVISVGFGVAASSEDMMFSPIFHSDSSASHHSTTSLTIRPMDTTLDVSFNTSTPNKHQHIDRAEMKFGRKERNVLFNNALNTFYLRLYGGRHMLNDHSDSERGNLLPPYGATISD